MSCAVSLAVSLPSQAITTEQLIFLEAWRAVDRAYVDKTFNGQSWFRVLTIVPATVSCPLMCDADSLHHAAQGEVPEE